MLAGLALCMSMAEEGLHGCLGSLARLPVGAGLEAMFNSWVKLQFYSSCPGQPKDVQEEHFSERKKKILNLYAHSPGLLRICEENCQQKNSHTCAEMP